MPVSFQSRSLSYKHQRGDYMSLTVKINIKDNNGTEAGLEINETDNLSKLVIIQNVFHLFGIEKDILDQTKELEER